MEHDLTKSSTEELHDLYETEKSERGHPEGSKGSRHYLAGRMDALQELVEGSEHGPDSLDSEPEEPSEEAEANSE